MIIISPVVNMRKTPSAAAEVVSQGLFAEKVALTQVSGDWSLISTPDGYSGWVLSDSLAIHPEKYEPSVIISRVATHLYADKDSTLGPLLTLPFGVRLKVIDTSDPDWISIQLPQGECCFVRKGTVVEHKILSREEMIASSFDFLGSPYTWGGRSSFGFDCSGFIQMLYGQMGIGLERDAGPQSRDSRFHEIAMDHLQPGDLIFWGLSTEKIRHVGLYIGQGQFIHATSREHRPYLRISNLRDSTWDGGADSVYPHRIFKALN
jgi:hypothetical protein